MRFPLDLSYRIFFGEVLWIQTNEAEDASFLFLLDNEE